MEWNAESVLDALNDFERKPEISPILNEYLKRIAKNGEIVFPWSKLKPLLKKKLDIVLDEFYETCPVETSVPIPNFETFNFDSLKKTILQAVDSFTSAPFTIQRLCELVTDPTKHYNRTDKYMRGIEKNVLVVSTIEPRSAAVGDGSNANINPIVNGILSDSPRDDNDTLNGHENTENISSSNLNTPSNHVLLENFANVFPSAACIPSASNICINRDMDSNFLANSECVETQEIEFEPTPSVVQTDNPVTKEEDMDTTEDEQVNGSGDNSEVTAGDSESPEHSDTSESEKPPAPEPVDKEPESDPPPSTSVEDVSASENIKSEADCSESHFETSTSDPETSESVECQQDDTISQSDDDSRNASSVSQSIDVVPEKLDTSQSDDSLPEVTTEESQSITTSESSDQCMELESSTTSDEPPV